MKWAVCILLLCLCAASAFEEDQSAIDDWFVFNLTNVEKAQQKLRTVASMFGPELAQATQTWTKSPATKILRSHNTSGAMLTPSMLQGRFWNNQCRRDLTRSIVALLKRETWVLQMVDAFGKPQSGLLRGEFKWAGSYDECLQVTVPPDSHHLGFHGRYAWITFTSKSKSLSQLLSYLTIGACLPSSCAEDDNFNNLYSSVVEFLEIIPFVKKVVKELPVIHVTFVPENSPLSTASVVCIFICTLFTILVLVGTFVDAVERTRESNSQKAEESPESTSTKKDDDANNCEEGRGSTNDAELITPAKQTSHKCLGKEFLLCFSAITNAKSILNTNVGDGQLGCVHGIRVLSMAWVILGHTYVMGVTSFGNLTDILTLFDTWPFQVIVQGTYSVDTFFLLSGFLLTFLFFKNEKAFSGSKSWIMFYVHRYIRLTPVYAMVIFVYSTWWNNLSNGPLWTTATQQICSKHWWWNLLYINNFQKMSDICVGWSWYLANDMQFYVISPLFLLAFKRDKIVGVLVVSVLLVGSWIATGVISKVNNYHIMFQGMDKMTDQTTAQAEQAKLFDDIYDKPYTRIGPYLIGVLLAYVLNEVKGTQKILNKWMVMVGWLGSQCLSLVLIYGLYRATLGPATESAYNTLARTMWGLSVAWVIFACLKGHGGPVDTFLSWKVWIPLSRLTYCAYLVHPLIMYWFYNSLKTPVYFSTSLIVINYLAFFPLSYGVAFLTSLLFEAPIMKLEKFIRAARS